LLPVAVIIAFLSPGIHKAFGQGLAFESKTIAVGNGPSSVVAADINNDGNVELICTDSKDNALTVLTNDGSGGFVSNATYSLPGVNPACVVAADVNGDSMSDLIVALYNSNEIMVLTNNGTGGFGSNAVYSVGQAPSCVVAADINGDGNPDLITANTSGYPFGGLTILTNDGSGDIGFDATLRVGATIPDDESHWVAAADINGDGKLDLISADILANTLTVLTNNGNGSFGSNATYNVGFEPQCVVVADVNGDGKPDLISANYGHAPSVGTLTVLTNDGSGLFVSNATYNVGAGAFFVTATDINGDGKPDLICANSNTNTLTVLTNDGSGGFDFCTTLTVGHGPRSIAVTNVNGRLELITANWGDASTGYGSNNTLTVLIQLPPPPELTVATAGPDVITVSWPLSATNFVLQTNADLTTTNWGIAGFAVSTNGLLQSITVNPALTGNLYFRLIAQ